MLYLKPDGTFGDTHEAQGFNPDYEFDPIDLVAEYADSDECYEVFAFEAHIVDNGDDFNKGIEVEDAPNSDIFYKDLIEYTEDELGYKLSREEKEQLCEEGDNYYEMTGAEDLCKQMIEKAQDDYWEEEE